MIGIAIPLISKYSGSFVVSQIPIVIAAPTIICNESKIIGFNGIKLIAKTGIAIIIETPKLGRISFICSFLFLGAKKNDQTLKF